MIALASIVMAGGLLATEATTAIEKASETFKAACLDIRGDRDALARLARERGWETGRARLQSTQDWGDAYRDGGHVIRLSHYPASRAPEGPSPEQLICVVDFVQTDANWPAVLSKLVVDGEPLGAPSEPPASYQIPDGLTVLIWDLKDSSRIHGTYVASQRRLELSVNYPVSR